MPLPEPKKGEAKDEFVSRCMGDTEANNKFPDQKQRAAVCYRQWEDVKKKMYDEEVAVLMRFWGIGTEK